MEVPRRTVTAPLASSPQRLEALPMRRRKTRHVYAPFRTTCFSDKLTMPANHDSRRPLSLGSAAESAKLWATHGPVIGTAPKLDVKTGAMYVPMLDRIYDSGKLTLGYRVHQSLAGSTLWNTTERFADRPTTSDRVGPGAYESVTSAWEKERSRKWYPSLPESPSHRAPFTPTLEEPRPQANEALAPLDTWKRTTKVHSPAKVAFDRAHRTTWIDETMTRDDRLRKKSLGASQSCPTLDLPNFLTGSRTGVFKA
ncbi:hypothetical protein ACHHYP_14270 [Achlya hypogyna]|uniref:Uncharacterized protein n=1 Tax=Achlya hypogyna TaxID=1202772 RepID=A0A1V9YDL0_ACHHY|nr:hypothetical protein ACHHYP_14270 [Achlya hypogyna]